MRKPDNVEVDADELSDSVRDELVENGTYDEEEAEKWAKRVWLEEEVRREPERTTLASRVRSGAGWVAARCGEAAGAVRDWSKRLGRRAFRVATRRAEASIEEARVVREDDVVSLRVEHPSFGSGVIRLEVASAGMANLLAYTGVDNPIDLDGESVVLDVMTLEDGSTRVLIPSDVSFVGRARFRLFGLLGNLLEKLWIKSEEVTEVVGGSIVAGVIVWLLSVMVGLSAGPTSGAGFGLLQWWLLAVSAFVAVLIGLSVVYLVAIGLLGGLYHYVVRGDFISRQVR